jgi:hypothetical protein
MTADTIRRLFFTPTVAIARLGASSSPMEAFDWGPGDPHTIGETRVKPAWSLNVDAQGTVTAFLPTELHLRDGALQRPVAPFLELWALTGDGGPTDWTPAPITPALLSANGVGEADVTFTVTAMNMKAARRTGSAALRYGTFGPVTLVADEHGVVPLRGESPPEAAEPMIPRGRHIPLGTVQALRPRPQPAAEVVPADVRLDVLRLRYTPAAGLFYGPPQAAGPQPQDGPAVPAERAFLNPDAGWMNASFFTDDGTPQTAVVTPPDTYDMFRRDNQGVSLGVVDDTCELVIAATLPIAGNPLAARANIAVGPPHFAPDRRPFLSLADEINDREYDPDRDAALTPEQYDRWIEDLFERVYETASLLDLDFWRAARGATVPDTVRRMRRLPPDDGVEPPEQAMGGMDPLRDPDIAIAAREPGQPFPLAERARERHRSLSDLTQLRAWLLAHPDRLDALIRKPFTVSAEENSDVSSMQMPPFMRNSNALPLTLAQWQYRLLMTWKNELIASGLVEAVTDAGPPLSTLAALRRSQVLELLAQDQP